MGVFTRNSKDYDLAQEYLKQLRANKPGTYILEPWEEELAKWEWTRPLLTAPSPTAIAKLRGWADQQSSN
jgi:hypothetical protein